MIKKKCPVFLQNKYFPFAFLAVLMLILHIFVQYFGDDIWFKNAVIDTGYFNLLKIRFNVWTSRIIIESVLYLIVDNIIIFRLLNIFFIFLLTASLTRLFSSEMNLKTGWAVVLLFLIYPFIEMSSAGWAATSINYLWTAALGLFSLIPFVKEIKDEQIRCFEYPFYVVALIFAVNHEQTAALLLGMSIAFTAYILIRDKSISKFLFLCNIISLGGIILIILCPGNRNRTILETETWFPLHSSLSIKFQILLGICNTLKYLFYESNTFIFLLSIILLLIIIKRKIGVIPTTLASITVIFCFLTNLARGNFRAALFPSFNEFLSHLDLQSHPYSGIANIIPIMICCAVLGLIFIEIYLIYGKSYKSGLLLLILCAGLSSSTIIGFSPTIYASSYRIFLLLNLALITVIILIGKVDWKNFSHRSQQIFYAILIIFGGYSYIESFAKMYIA